MEVVGALPRGRAVVRPLPLSWREGPIASGRVLLRQITGIGKSRLASVVFLLLGQSWEGKRGYSRVMGFHQSVFSVDARLLCLLCRVGDSGPSRAVGRCARAPDSTEPGTRASRARAERKSKASDCSLEVRVQGALLAVSFVRISRCWPCCL